MMRVMIIFIHHERQQQQTYTIHSGHSGEVRTYGFRDMCADRNKNMHTDRETRSSQYSVPLPGAEFYQQAHRNRVSPH